MVAILHDKGWAVSNDAKLDMGFDGIRQYQYVSVNNHFDAVGILMQGGSVELLINGKELLGEVNKIGTQTTTILIKGVTNGLKDKIKQILNNG